MTPNERMGKSRPGTVKRIGCMARCCGAPILLSWAASGSWEVRADGAGHATA
jgi:hypothetical protein